MTMLNTWNWYNFVCQLHFLIKGNKNWRKVGEKQVNENEKNEVESVRDTMYLKVTKREDFQVSYHRNEMVNMCCDGGVS